MDVIDQVISIYNASQGYMEDVPLAELHHFEEDLLYHVKTNYPEIESDIRKSGKLSEDTEDLLVEAIKKFKEINQKKKEEEQQVKEAKKNG